MGRKPDPWQLPDWALAGSDGTFGTRFEDPKGQRVQIEWKDRTRA